MKNCFHGEYFKSYLPAKPGIFTFFIIFRVGRHASEILDIPLLVSYTMIGHGM